MKFITLNKSLNWEIIIFFLIALEKIYNNHFLQQFKACKYYSSQNRPVNRDENSRKD